ncbi:MAG: PH domain-containing protein [Clostridia bacterium]|jgi:membrane protein YdbS with pleckstrin-like domain|nr:hypothetical protein [Clostridia bacterium]MDD4275432.1 PH domain-containing protein [Clostridia bacterium]
MEEIFTNILDKDEVIIRTFKPNKAKLFLSSILLTFFVLIWIVATPLIGMLSSGVNVQIIVPITLLALAFILVVALLFTSIYYSNLYYAYTNKRLIIRTGVFGVDYKSLDMAMIGAINVYVSLLDKLLKKNTGSITFGSMASPMVSSSNGGVSNYKFAHIVAPYDSYREIKNIIEDYKESKNKKAF